MIRRSLMAASLLSLVAFGGRAAAAEEAKLDLSALKRVPVHAGQGKNDRIMPFDTFAREAVETICGRQSPELSLVDTGTGFAIDAPQLVEARTLFPGDEPRKFDSAELVLSWLVEPEKWNEVPFMEAKHEELRKLLDVPLKNEENVFIGLVSPRQVEDATAYWARFQEIRDEQRAAQAEGKQQPLSELDQRVLDLATALQEYRSLSLDMHLDAIAADSFRKALEDVAETWRAGQDIWGAFATMTIESPIVTAAGQFQGAFDELAKLYDEREIETAVAEKQSLALAASARALTDAFKTQQEALSQPGKAPFDDPEKLANLQETLGHVATAAEVLAERAQAVADSLYDNGEALRVVPALNVKALEGNRRPEDQISPWLDLQSILFASDGALAAYPQPQLAAARDAFRQLATAYRDRAATDRAERVAVASRTFARSLSDLGEAVEPARQALPLEHRDDDYLAYTAYPSAGFTETEVTYNTVKPFQWSWAIAFLSFLLVAASFGGKVRSVYWLGLAVLLGGFAWAVYGFALRVMITGWAPVTNMYETVIYVPWFVSLLGLWFALLPMNWPGITLAWRLAAMPFTWEATRPNDDEARVIGASAWKVANFALMLPRLGLTWLLFNVLTRWNYAAGGRNILNLLPQISSGDEVNDLLTWAVGMCVLLPALWYVPRAAVALAASLVTVPLTLATSAKPMVSQIYPRWPFALSASFVAFLGSLTAWLAPADILNPSFSPLTPVLRDNFWLTIHVLTIVSSYGAGALAWGIGNIALGYYLFGKYRAPARPTNPHNGYQPAHAAAIDQAKRPPEECHTLAGYVYKTMQVAMILLVTGTILGGLWADVSWGRFWGWDPKEVWALISFLVYIAIVHGRYAGWFGDFGLCVGAVLGASAIIFSWYGVNFVLGAGLHSYGFGSGGQYEVFGTVLANWLFLGAAGARYWYETKPGKVAAAAAAKVDKREARGMDGDMTKAPA